DRLGDERPLAPRAADGTTEVHLTDVEFFLALGALDLHRHRTSPAGLTGERSFRESRHSTASERLPQWISSPAAPFSPHQTPRTAARPLFVRYSCGGGVFGLGGEFTDEGRPAIPGPAGGGRAAAARVGPCLPPRRRRPPLRPVGDRLTRPVCRTDGLPRRQPTGPAAGPA